MIQLIMLPINLVGALVGFMASGVLSMIGGFLGIATLAAGAYWILVWLERT